ncbi:MAG: hypothetical protein D8H95_42920 [Lachnospiraceae bacterium]|nr:MAG: hypothetical protein D8H95_42920 [Lachnospiraceae bacterium]
MDKIFAKRPNGYQDSISKGIAAVYYFRGRASYGKGGMDAQIKRLKEEIENADAILIGAGAGLSTSAGFTYTGERFDKYFFDFAKTFGIKDIYSGGFYPFPKKEIFWAWWARSIYFNRYVDAPKPVYKDLLDLVKDKDHFVITTNVDHQFQRSGFDKKRLFYTQGDFGLFQSTNPDCKDTFDNKVWVEKALKAQGFIRNDKNEFIVPVNKDILMEIPTELIPKTPKGDDVTTNLRIDDTFVEDEGWHNASSNYADFIRRHENLHVLFLELGVGANTPVIIKYPFWQMTYDNKKAIYVCLNYGEAFCPEKINDRSICIDGDIGDVLKKIN